MSVNWIGGPGLAEEGAEGGGMPGGSENETLRHDGSAWVPTTVLQTREDGVDIGTDDEHEHNFQGQSMFFGGEHATVLDVIGVAQFDSMHAWEIVVAGGQYPGFYGYGDGGDQYPGFPYWGSYPSDASGPQHGTGTTIDRRGIRTDERILAERGITVYDVVRDNYLNVTFESEDDGSITLVTSIATVEPNA